MKQFPKERVWERCAREGSVQEPCVPVDKFVSTTQFIHSYRKEDGGVEFWVYIMSVLACRGSLLVAVGF